MKTEMLERNAMEVAQIVMTIPIFVAALISAVPVLLMCVTCRCCKKSCLAAIDYFRTFNNRL